MALVIVDSVEKTYTGGEAPVHALRGVSFTLGSGDFVALMGPSGCGKSTLLHLCGAMDRPSAGQIRFNDQSLAALDDRRLTLVRREQVGFVFQSMNLLQSLTALENVRYALELAGFRGRHAHERARELLSMLDLGHCETKLPKLLSGGEQQRVAIARAFANRSRVVLADEPTASLDHAHATEVMDLLRALSHDLATPVLMVTHDLRIHSFADRLLWLEGGRLEPLTAAEMARRGIEG
jgi:putative ABC transport system ATP-binding protein